MVDQLNTYWKILISIYIFLLGFPLLYVQSKVPPRFKNLYNRHLGKYDLDILFLSSLVLAIYFCSIGNPYLINTLIANDQYSFVSFVLFLNTFFLIAFFLLTAFYFSKRWSDYYFDTKKITIISERLYKTIEQKYFDHITRKKLDSNIKSDYISFIMNSQDNYSIEFIFNSLMQKIKDTDVSDSHLGDVHDPINELINLFNNNKLREKTKLHIVDTFSLLLKGEKKYHIHGPACNLIKLISREVILEERDEILAKVMNWQIDSIDFKYNLLKQTILLKKPLMAFPFIRPSYSIFNNEYIISLCALLVQMDKNHLDRVKKIINKLSIEQYHIENALSLNSDDFFTLNAVERFIPIINQNENKYFRNGNNK